MPSKRRKWRTKAIHFGEDDKELLEHAEAQGNFSKYVRELIRRDMLGEAPPNVEELVKRLVAQYTSTPSQKPQKTQTPPKPKPVDVDEPDDDMLKGLF